MLPDFEVLVVLISRVTEGLGNTDLFVAYIVSFID